MKYWLLYNVLGVSWSLYLLVIHASKKDHLAFQALLFGLWFSLMVKVLRRYSFQTARASVHLCLSFLVVSVGHWFFNWVVY